MWAFQLATAEESEQEGSAPWARVKKPHEGHSSIASHKEWRSARMETDGGAAVPQEHVLRATYMLSHCNSATLPPRDLHLSNCLRVT